MFTSTRQDKAQACWVPNKYLAPNAAMRALRCAWRRGAISLKQGLIVQFRSAAQQDVRLSPRDLIGEGWMSRSCIMTVRSALTPADGTVVITLGRRGSPAK